MAEYIDREALIKAIDNNFAKLDMDVCNPPYYYGANDEYADVRLIIHKQPTADVQPVKRGKWIEDDNCFHHCSECKKNTIRDIDDYGCECGEFLTDFCPNCGADMQIK